MDARRSGIPGTRFVKAKSQRFSFFGATGGKVVVVPFPPGYVLWVRDLPCPNPNLIRNACALMMLFGLVAGLLEASHWRMNG
jgi:hypothetical protein